MRHPLAEKERAEMSTQTKTVQELAKEAETYFETAYRTAGDSDTAFARIKDGAPAWVTDMVRESHDGMLPDDYKYEWAREAVEHIAQVDAHHDPDECRAEFADPDSAMPYTADRLAWLASNLNRVAYCDEAADEYGEPESGGITARIALGIYAERDEIYGSVLAFIQRMAA